MRVIYLGFLTNHLQGKMEELEQNQQEWAYILLRGYVRS